MAVEYKNWEFVCVNCRKRAVVRALDFWEANRFLGESDWRIERWDRHGWGLICNTCRTVPPENLPD